MTNLDLSEINQLHLLVLFCVTWPNSLIIVTSEPITKTCFKRRFLGPCMRTLNLFRTWLVKPCPNRKQGFRPFNNSFKPWMVFTRSCLIDKNELWSVISHNSIDSGVNAMCDLEDF